VLQRVFNQFAVDINLNSGAYSSDDDKQKYAAKIKDSLGVGLRGGGNIYRKSLIDRGR
jgi:hypothetical protein